MDALLWIAVGFALGWVILQRPEWATDIVTVIRAKLGW